MPLARRVRGFDTVSFCFSKGLGCPVGSILCGDRARMDRARRMRKMLGGATRQAGLLAAAALHALDHHVDCLADDHRRAHTLADQLTRAGFEVQPPETNILAVHVPDAPRFVEALAGHGVRCFPIAEGALRLVLHLGIGDGDVEATARAFVAARG